MGGDSSEVGEAMSEDAIDVGEDDRELPLPSPPSRSERSRYSSPSGGDELGRQDLLSRPRPASDARVVQRGVGVDGPEIGAWGVESRMPLRLLPAFCSVHLSCWFEGGRTWDGLSSRGAPATPY